MKWLLTIVIGLSFVFANAAFAKINPFKKFKAYDFGADVVWYESNDTAMKSGSVRDGANINYYHLSINKQRILLRLGMNDPSGLKPNTRSLENMSISDVKIDGHRLPLFDWCLRHQHDPGRKLVQNAIVVNNVCQNEGGGGDFIIQLDDETRHVLKSADKIEFVVEPYGRALKINFNLQGYAPIIAKLNKKPKSTGKKIPGHTSVSIESRELQQPRVVAPTELIAPAPTVAPASKSKSKSVAVKKKPKKQAKSKPAAAKKSKNQTKTKTTKSKPKVVKTSKSKKETVITPKPKVVATKSQTKTKLAPVVKATKREGTCYAKAPVDFRSTIPSLPYPCGDENKKKQAENNIMGSVKYEKRKIAAELKAAKDGLASKQKENQKSKRNAEWEAKQTKLWVARCKRHWDRKRSPCYCKKYLEFAPRGVKDTCR